MGVGDTEFGLGDGEDELGFGDFGEGDIKEEGELLGDTIEESVDLS